MRKQLQKLLLLFAFAIFLLLLSFSFIIYFSTKNSVNYQQRLISQSVINEELAEHVIIKDGKITIWHQDKVNYNELPTIYFITKGESIVKQSNYAQQLIEYIHKHMKKKAYTHHYVAFDDRHYYVSSIQIGEKKNDSFIYTVVDSTESYHALDKLKKMLIGVSLLYIFLIVMLAYYLSQLAVKPYKKAIQLQKDFVQNASHELKTPISVIKSGLTVLKTYEQSHLSEIGNEAIADLEEEVEHMKVMVNQMLLLETVQHSEKSIINLADTCIEVTQRFQPLLQYQTELELTDTFVEGNYEALSQALAILFDNAIKYNGREVRIKLSLRDNKLTFKDDGKGIDESAIEHIFERFYRGTEVGEVEGTGIGLSLFKEIMESHHARVQVISENGLQFIIDFKK